MAAASRPERGTCLPAQNHRGKVLSQPNVWLAEWVSDHELDGWRPARRVGTALGERNVTSLRLSDRRRKRDSATLRSIQRPTTLANLMAEFVKADEAGGCQAASWISSAEGWLIQAAGSRSRIFGRVVARVPNRSGCSRRAASSVASRSRSMASACP